VPGIEVNKTDSSGETALHGAAAYNHLQCVQLLCEYEAVDVNCRNKDGETPLMLPVFFGYHEVVQVIISLPRVDLNAVNERGETALMLAVSEDEKLCVELLRDAGTTQ
jgi:ankyrin repeat protein